LCRKKWTEGIQQNTKADNMDMRTATDLVLCEILTHTFRPPSPNFTGGGKNLKILAFF